MDSDTLTNPPRTWVSIHSTPKLRHTSTHHFKNNLNLQTAARAYCNICRLIQKIVNKNLKLVATGTWIGEEHGIFVVSHVLNLNLVVNAHFKNLSMQITGI